MALSQLFLECYHQQLAVFQPLPELESADDSHVALAVEKQPPVADCLQRQKSNKSRIGSKSKTTKATSCIEL